MTSNKQIETYSTDLVVDSPEYVLHLHPPRRVHADSARGGELMAYKENMSVSEKESRVLQQLKKNSITSRQSGDQWLDVVNAYQAWLDARDEAT